jgi:catechol 2,3-dioxygenase-like lactoylglutathione lyase family enzyme
MLSHVYIGINDFERAFDFYAALMDTLHLKLKFRDVESGCAGWVDADHPRPLFVISRPYNGKPATTGNGQMVGLLAPDRPSVERVHATALAHGGSCEGPPGLRPQYHAHYYGAYFRDPEGNKLCICCHDPA